jgi:Glu-tRNA(Gln) amidotransferase subunit E-like FAD-binding protein
MADLNYEELGFKCGIEIHQQLEGHKLFCSCPTTISKDAPDFTVTRRLRASAGESGAVDRAALHEQKKQKYFIYQGYDALTCGVELDEEPPHPINQDALKTVLQVAKMLNCKIVDEIQVMRKTVIDGSNTSGFQRTMLVGMDGFVEVHGKKIGIDTICLEEEACQVIDRKKDHDVYNLSRLGIPLIEIATGPHMKTPEEAKEVAAKIGMMLRSTENCKRGIGTIRQDVNLSVKGGSRVEIKGFQDLKSIAKVIDREIERQLKILKDGKHFDPEVRNAEDDFTTSYLRPMPGMDRMYPETDIPPIVPDVDDIKSVKTIEEKVKEIESRFKLSNDLAVQIVKGSVDLETYANKYRNIDPKFIADTIISVPKEIKARFKKEIKISDHIDGIFAKLDSGQIPKGAVFEILVEIADGKNVDYSKYKGVGDEEIEEYAIKLIKENPALSTGALMGLVMAKYRGKIDGKKAMELLSKHKK